MQISDVMGRRVADADGARVGKVADVRLVQDGPFVEGFGNTLRVDALVVGRGGVASRLGYVRGGVRGPWPRTRREAGQEPAAMARRLPGEGGRRCAVGIASEARRAPARGHRESDVSRAGEQRAQNWFQRY